MWHGQRKLILAVAVVALVLGTILLFPNRAQQRKASPVGPAGAALSPTGVAATGSSNPPVDLSINVAEDVTIENMVKKGLPIPSNPRQYMLTSGNQSLEDCVKDVGNRFTLAMGPVHAMSDFDGISAWVTITYHPKAMRIVEEGRKRPDKVIPLLLAEIRRDMDPSLAEMEVSYREIVFHGPVLIADNDPKYKESREYSNVAGEYPRRMYAIGQCFYALANMDALSQAKPELAAFAQTKLHARPLAFSVELISCLVNELQKRGQPVDPELAAATKEIQLVTVARSAWNAPVDIHDPMATMVNLNTSSVRTLQVLAIPRDIKMPADKQEFIVDRYTAFAKSPA